MVGRLRFDVRDDLAEHAHIVLIAAFIKPVHIARDALAKELREIGPRNWADMRIGKMGEPEVQEILSDGGARRAALSASGWVSDTSAFGRHLP